VFRNSDRAAISQDSGAATDGKARQESAIGNARNSSNSTSVNKKKRGKEKKE
jgi:hypothetical protein